MAPKMMVDFDVRLAKKSVEVADVSVEVEPTVLFTPMSTRLLLVCRFRRDSLSWSGIPGATIEPFLKVPGLTLFW